MKDNVKENLKVLLSANGSNESFNQIMTILDLPDKDFDEAYIYLKPQLNNIFTSQELQKEVINVAKISPVTEDDKREAKETLINFIKEIEQDDTLSENKKDMIINLIKGSMDLTFSLADNPRERVEVEVQKISEDAILPTYAHDSDAGADIYSIEDVTIPPHKIVIVKTGLKVAIPLGYEIQIRPRSGLSYKTPLRIANTPGTIDTSYRGEIGVIMENTGNLTQKISKGDRIAQMIISPVPMIVWKEVSTLDETERGEGGFGSTDKS